jgi:hypothetical protein
MKYRERDSKKKRFGLIDHGFWQRRCMHGIC